MRFIKSTVNTFVAIRRKREKTGDFIKYTVITKEMSNVFCKVLLLIDLFTKFKENKKRRKLQSRFLLYLQKFADSIIFIIF